MMVRPFITTICLHLLSLLFIGMIGGCGFSTSVPQEQYIQIDYPPIKKTDVVDMTTPVIMIRDFNSLPAFDRSAIMFSQDGVLMPAAFLYWEGSPAEILAHYFAYGLNASGEFRTLHPYSPTNRDAEVLRGRVLSFEVDKTDMVFRITFSASLWSAPNGTWLSGETFTVEEPMQGFSPSQISMAANQGLQKMLAKVSDWLQQYHPDREE